MNNKEIVAGTVAITSLLYFAVRKLSSKSPKLTDLRAKLPRGSEIPSHRNLENIEYITLHHSASSQTKTAYDHARTHISNWNRGIEYCFFVDNLTGEGFITNDLNKLLYHTGGGMNLKTVGICVGGNFENDKLSDKANKTVIEICRYLGGDKRLPNLKDVRPHKYFKPTACPGSNFPHEEIRRKAGFASYKPTAFGASYFEEVDENDLYSDN